MAYEVDILAVGDESHSGDAIALRFGDFMNDPTNQKVVVIDGGFTDSGKTLVDRIKNEYGTDHVDLVISTHPDADHLSGLHIILEELKVDELWIHRPWNMSADIKKIAEENRGLTTLGLSNKLKKSLESAYDLEKLAVKKGVSIKDPFQGLSAFDNVIHILGPSEDFYHELVTDFDKSPGMISIGSVAKRIISEVWHQDELAEPEEGATSARNNSSTIILVQLDGRNFMFTGDAGVKALHIAADYASSNNFGIKEKIHYLQVPHHGSKRNIGPEILNKIIGPIVPQGQKVDKTVFVSAAIKGHPKHPSPRVTNAFVRRGATLVKTCGTNHCYKSDDIPTREGWGPIQAVGFINSHDDE